MLKDFVKRYVYVDILKFTHNHFCNLSMLSFNICIIDKFLNYTFDMNVHRNIGLIEFVENKTTRTIYLINQSKAEVNRYNVPVY